MTPWRNYRLRTKINLLLFLVLAVFLAISIYWQYLQLREFEFAEAIEKARIITAEANRTREYISRQLQVGQVELDKDRYGLIPVVASNRVGRLVAEDLDYAIRHTSNRFRNPDNAPDSYEREALRRLETEAGLPYVAEISTWQGEPAFRFLSPAHAEASCLECHGEPEQSPEFLRDIYPPEQDQSYHYQPGEVIGAVSIIIPMTSLEKQFLSRFKSTLVTTGGFFLVLVVCLGLLIRQAVIQPLGALADTIGRIGRTGEFSERLPVRSEDETGALVSGFNGMLDQIGAKTAQLEESEQRFRLLTELARDAIIAFLPNGKIFLFNRQAEKMFGYRQADLLGESFSRLMAPDRPLLGKDPSAFLAAVDEDWFNGLHRLTGVRSDRQRIEVDMSLAVVKTGDKPFYTAILRQVGPTV